MARPSRKTAVISDSDNESKQPSPQEGEKDVIKTAQRIVRDTKNIRNKKRNSIEDDYNKRRRELKLKIDKQFEMRQIAITKHQFDTWEKLESLNKKLQLIEGSILRSMTNLESATLHITNQMILVLRESIHEHQSVNFSASEN